MNARRNLAQRRESRFGRMRVHKALNCLLVVLLITPVLLAGWGPKPTVEPKRARK